jgi:hypothetical protein
MLGLGLVAVVFMPPPTYACSRENEGKLLVAVMNRMQQAHWLEHDRFATSMTELDIGVTAERQFYRLRIQPDEAVIVHYA